MYSDIEECIKNVGNKYMTVVVVSKRIKDLTRPSTHNTPTSFLVDGMKELPFVLNEVSQGKVVPSVAGN